MLTSLEVARRARWLGAAMVISTAGPALAETAAPSSAAQTVEAPTAEAPALTAETPAPAPEEEPTSWGRFDGMSVPLYPLWEETGRVMEAGQLYFGTEHVGGGLVDSLELGLQPSYFIHRAPNLEARVRLYHQGGLQLAWRQGALFLFEGAGDNLFFDSYRSRLANPSGELLLLPSTVAVTWQARPFLALHAAATVLPEISFGGPIQSHVFGGFSAMAELKFLPGNLLVLHAGEVGLWEHEFFYVGASYRVNYAWFIGRIGYFYRVFESGVQGSPMFSLGVAL